MKASIIAALLIAAAPVASASLAQTPAATPAKAPQDALTDAAMKGPEVIAFIGLKPGDRIADIVAGRFVRAFSQAVGPTGKVYAVEPAEVLKVHGEILAMMQGMTAMPAYANVALLTPPIGAPALPAGLDAVFIRQNYHDLHDKFMGPADVAAFNKAVFAALTPGGIYVVLDHAAPGTGLAATETLHRIDPAAVKAEVIAAGFVLDGESAILANPADPHDKNVFDPSIRSHTDQFLLRFRKPK
jgi:predicted methyltransferase